MSQPAAMPADQTLAPGAQGLQAPIVIVGNGPAGMAAARQLLARRRGVHLVIYGAERHQPYNRVRLSSVLAGEVDWEGVTEQLFVPAAARVEQRLGYTVTALDYRDHCVVDDQGLRQPYSKLILATGSRPHIPAIPGIELPGVYTFRNRDDADALMARRVRSHHTVVLGGGLLGLEAARGMQRNGTRVTVVEHADRLMGNQLDRGGSTALAQELSALGLELGIGDGARKVLGEMRVEGLLLQSGRHIDCDTVIVATGIRPNVALAQEARIAWGNGIRVDDQMRTSVADVYAIGECAEHRGRIYGLVAPGLEQAGVAVNHILGEGGSYQGSLAATRLKVAGCAVFSMGPMGAVEERLHGRRYRYRDAASGVYRTLLVNRNRLQGAVAIGPWDDTARLQSAIAEQGLVWPWQLWRFRRNGSLWPDAQGSDLATWPAHALVCQCKSVSRGQLGEAIAGGAASVDALRACTGAASVCGSCKPLLEQLLGSATPEPVPLHRWLVGSAVVSLLAALAFLLLPAIPYADSVQVSWRWDQLWRDGLLKQVSGFSVLGLFVLGLLLSPRKRVTALQSWGRFDLWRLVHIAVGLLVLAALLAHTGLRLGTGLNAVLMVSFTVTLLLGAISSGVIGLEHRIGGALAARLRRQSVWWHILWFWPVPVALGFHVLGSYWF
jgi:nitrite reductase (NADH) large subunit